MAAEQAPEADAIINAILAALADAPIEVCATL